MRIININPIQGNIKYYVKAFKWCFVVLILLLLPYIFSSYIDFITSTALEQNEGFGRSLIEKIKFDINNGKFLFIPIGLASASYIDYVFQKGLIIKEAEIHITFSILLMIILGMFTCIDLKNTISESKVFDLEYDNIHRIIFIHLIVSFLYSTGVKSIIFNYRERIGSNSR